MQDDQTVDFSPMYVDGPMPWYERLYALYLFAILIVLVVQLVLFGLRLWRIRKLANDLEANDAIRDAIWAKCCTKANSFKQFAILTFLISALTLVMWTSDTLANVRTEKTVSVPFVLAQIGEGLASFGMGIFVCIALYVAAIFAEALLRRKRPSGTFRPRG